MRSRDINRQESEMEKHEKDYVPTYERPSVVDYGTLVEITRAANAANGDVPNGVSNAFPPAS